MSNITAQKDDHVFARKVCEYAKILGLGIVTAQELADTLCIAACLYDGKQFHFGGDWGPLLTLDRNELRAHFHAARNLHGGLRDNHYAALVKGAKRSLRKDEIAYYQRIAKLVHEMIWTFKVTPEECEA